MVRFSVPFKMGILEQVKKWWCYDLFFSSFLPRISLKYADERPRNFALFEGNYLFLFLVEKYNLRVDGKIIKTSIKK